MPSLSNNDLDILIAEAEKAVSRLRRRLGFAYADLDDLRQDLLTDLIRRLPSFDSTRGTLGAFASTILRHRASRIADRLLRERHATGGSLLSLEATDSEGTSLRDRLSEEGGLAAWHDRPAAKLGIERRIEIGSALEQLDPPDRALCAAVARWSVDQLVTCGFGSRSVVYRRLGEIRLVLTAYGLDTEWGRTGERVTRSPA